MDYAFFPTMMGTVKKRYCRYGLADFQQLAENVSFFRDLVAHVIQLIVSTISSSLQESLDSFSSGGEKLNKLEGSFFRQELTAKNRSTLKIGKHFLLYIIYRLVVLYNYKMSIKLNNFFFPFSFCYQSTLVLHENLRCADIRGDVAHTYKKKGRKRGIPPPLIESFIPCRILLLHTPAPSLSDAYIYSL